MTVQHLLTTNYPSRQAEEAVIGCLLRWPQGLHEIDLRDQDFAVPECMWIYQAILHIQAKGKGQPDLVTVAEQLRENNNLVDIGGAAALARLFDSQVTGINVEHYARLVRGHAIRRALGHAGATIAHEAAHPVDPPEIALQRAENLILEIARMGVSGEARPLSECVDSAVDRIDARCQGEAQALGIPTGYLLLDEYTAGLHREELIVVGARPSTGKTAIGLALLLAVASQKEPVFMASLEQSRVDIAERLLVMASGVDFKNVRQGRLDSRSLDMVSQARSHLRQLPVHLDDRPGQTALRIASTARRLHRKQPLGMILVDYLQMVEPENRKDSPEQQVAGISTRMKQLARELQVPLVLLAQLNRESEHRQDRRPRLADIRGSGAVEQDADVVLLLHRNPEREDLLEILVEKQRNGPTGEFALRFDRARMRFEDYDPAGGPAW